MDVVWMVLGGLAMLAGLVGCLLPVLPGPPLCYVALLIQQLRENPPFTSRFLWIWAGVTVLVLILEYAIPVYGTRKYGGSRYGMWGCAIGLVAGLWFGPVGIIAGPFVGALAGELLANTDSQRAFRAAIGSFAGFLAGTLLKLIACSVMAYYLVISILAD